MCPTTTVWCVSCISPASHALLCTLRNMVLLTLILLGVTFKSDSSTLHSSRPTNSITFCCASLTNMPQLPSPRSPCSLPHHGSIPSHLLEASENGREQKGSGSSRLQIHKQIFHAANKLINSIVQQDKFHSIVLKYLPVLLPNNCSALLTVYLVKQNQHICPCLFFSWNFLNDFLIFFHSKIATICQSLDSVTVPPPSVPDPPFSGSLVSVPCCVWRKCQKDTRTHYCENVWSGPSPHLSFSWLSQRSSPFYIHHQWHP